MERNLFTFGYEGLSLESFLARLKSAGVKTVIDVRANPLSRKRGFSKRGLAAALEATGIKYAHAKAMGCPKPVRDRYKLDADWSVYTRDFLAYLNHQLEAVAEVARVADSSPSCLICFEADFNRCHRTFVARAAAKIGKFRITHIVSQTEIPDSASQAVVA
jgi:uncharacterized protein (DUF488 family)